jgi:hypothetical protein
MKRSKPLQRTGFPRPVRRDPVEAYRDAVLTGTGVVQGERPRPVAALLRPAAVVARIDNQVRAIPKVVPVRSEAYRRAVAQLPCRWCGCVGRSQAAHPNTGKGGASKTDDRLCFPLCADAPGVRGCHALFDQGALLDKTTRRQLEPAWGAETRQRIALLGLWPEGLPQWEPAHEQEQRHEEPAP